MLGESLLSLTAFVQVIMIDLVMAGDNAIAVGLAAATLPKAVRRRAVVSGVIAAAVLRIIFASISTYLMSIVGLTLAGGLLLIWVTWRMGHDIRASHQQDEVFVRHTLQGENGNKAMHKKTLSQAVLQIIIADVSMSLDNVLAVAGAARNHFGALLFGLALSVALMGVAATLIAEQLQKHRWIAYGGVLMVAYVALKMVCDGIAQVVG